MPFFYFCHPALVRIAPFQLINELLISIDTTFTHTRGLEEEKKKNENTTTTTTAPEARPTTKARFALFSSGQCNNTQDALLIISMAMDNLLNHNRNELTIEIAVKQRT